MNIGEAAESSNLRSKTIRYYEEIGLVAPKRAGNGYRDYDDADVHRLRFLGRARGLGFSVAECRNLLSLYSDKDRASRDVKAIARGKIEEIDRKIEELQSLRDTLAHLAQTCHGDDRPDCPILDGMAKSD
ncbi:Cu(I)-responsive transcriptional regulator [hydrothermal vent metagenome]|uniref:Cu(I)-responsive transcriptional regulator n=1 Tax=hydrothermal vent metagenome TaxID=652676 RepID=A0A3B0T1H8_9ZZZZ